MALSAETVARWSSSSLESMTHSIRTSRERMRLLQRDIERAERERGRELCTELRIQDELEDLEMKALRGYHDEGLTGANGGSSYVETFHGSRPLDVDWRSVRRHRDEARRQQQKLRTRSAEHAAVQELAHSNRVLGEEVARLHRLLEAQQQQFAQAAALDATSSGGGDGGGGGGSGGSGGSGIGGASGNIAPGSPASQGTAGMRHPAAAAAVPRAHAKSNPLESTLSTAYRNAIQLVHMHEAAALQTGSGQRQHEFEARAALHRANMQQLSQPVLQRMAEQQADLQLSLMRTQHRERLRTRTDLQQDLDQARRDFAATLESRHKGHVEQMFRRVAHEQQVGELTQQLGRRTEALVAALGRDVVGDAEAAHRAALRFREEEEYALGGIDFQRDDAVAQAAVAAAVQQSLPPPPAAVAAAAVPGAMDVPARATGTQAAVTTTPPGGGFGAPASSSAMGGGVRPGSLRLGPAGGLGDPSSDPEAARAMAEVLEQMTEVARLREQLVGADDDGGDDHFPPSGGSSRRTAGGVAGW